METTTKFTAKTRLELWHLGDLVETGEDTHEGLSLLKAAGVQYQQDWAKVSPFVGQMSIERVWSGPRTYQEELWTWDGKKVWTILNSVNEQFWHGK